MTSTRWPIPTVTTNFEINTCISETGRGEERMRTDLYHHMA